MVDLRGNTRAEHQARGETLFAGVAGPATPGQTRQRAQRPLSVGAMKIPAGQVRRRTAYNRPLVLPPPLYLLNEQKHNNGPRTVEG